MINMVITQYNIYTRDPMKLIKEKYKIKLNAYKSMTYLVMVGTFYNLWAVISEIYFLIRLLLNIIFLLYV